MHLESADDCVILEGAGPRPAPGAGGAYAAKYGFDTLGGEGGPPVYVLRPRVAFAWLESRFPETATRWRLS